MFMRIFQPLHNASLRTLPNPAANTALPTYPRCTRTPTSSVIKVSRPVVPKTFKHAKHSAPVHRRAASSSSHTEPTEHDYVVLESDAQDSSNDDFVFI